VSQLRLEEPPLLDPLEPLQAEALEESIGRVDLFGYVAARDLGGNGGEDEVEAMDLGRRAGGPRDRCEGEERREQCQGGPASSEEMPPSMHRRLGEVTDA